MLALASALILAAPSLSIHGGTPFERTAVRTAINQVPACFRDATDTPLRVQITPSDEANAYFDFEREQVEVNEAAIPGTALYEAALHDDAAYACTSVRRMRRFGNLDATLLHELVHHWQFDGEHAVAGSKRKVSNDLLVDRFLRIRFDRVRARARRDPRIRTLDRLLNNLDAIASWTDDEQARFCVWQDELDRRIARYGFPVRYPGDGPYTLDDGSGGEYFAEALETWAFFPDVFCSAYSADERAWLEQNLGSCMRTVRKLPSCAMPAASPTAPRAPVSRRTLRP
ncbi:MAG TPA: hypothetical protein VMV18_05460, partial [bacterium]|nr:hypothetical protein [bacterium]